MRNEGFDGWCQKAPRSHELGLWFVMQMYQTMVSFNIYAVMFENDQNISLLRIFECLQDPWKLKTRLFRF